MLSAANNPLYDGCENYSLISITGRMTNLKTDHNCSQSMYNDMCTLMREDFPQPNSLTSSFYDTMKQLAEFGLQS